jgi:hypothetical protein
MIRSKPMSRGKLPDRPARPDRSGEFASHRMPAVQAVMATPASFTTLASAPRAVPPHAKLSRQARTDTAIRDSANGEDCHVRLAGICNGRTDTTVWSHWPGLDADRGMGLKALDLCGAYACSACHDAIDGRAPLPEGTSRADVVLGWMFGHMRSLVTLVRKGLV